MAWELETTLIIKIPSLSEAAMERIGRAVVMLIERRTAKGIDKDGKPFVGYSDSYKESMEFKQMGKSRAVDLTGLGEMLADFGVIDSGRGWVSLGFEDEDQRAKAHGHITGQQGNGFPVRDFLGISKEELASIIRKSGIVKTEKAVESIMKEAVIV
jgi:hypothetical protein